MWGGGMRCKLCRYMWGFNERQAVLKYQSRFEGIIERREKCVLQWGYLAARPSGWYRAYIAKEQSLAR